jgi:predicted nucleic acid-binding Zn ribbon protein
LSQNKTTFVGDTVREYLDKRGFTKRVAQASVVNEWPSLVGPQLARVSQPVSVDRSDTLWVQVQSAAWMQELQMMSRMILHDLAKKGKRFTRIRWVLAESNLPENDRSDSPSTP